jgi:hypothetical protein
LLNCRGEDEIAVPADAKGEVIRLATALVRGEIEMAEGCRLLVSCFGDAQLRHDPDALLIIGFDSETDHFPVGPQRVHWNPTVLATKDAERLDYNAKAGPRLLAACRRLLAKLQADG